ncbi:MAG TPA: SDR family NAD(P)-dependent oxidoreductase [Jatrophihabitantaceae bacterium]|jgi:NAD(P)-dependent dehydrogenase (short-subunit alcohol dehydrogenase family)|nr:SDR family NAD(P)-dependent oxidoreductase [Jatrophihabitantaceae bacterium]
MREFDGRVAVVTGAGSGIGRALAIALARRGARLALSDVRTDDLAATAAFVPGAEVRHYPLDVTDAAAVQAHADQVVADFGSVDMLINNAGVSLTGDVVDMGLPDLAWVLDVDYWGVVHGTKAFLPHVIASRGHIVNISSVFGVMAVPSQSAYNAAKFAVRGFTEALRMEMTLAGTGVGVSCVLPGGIKTNVVRNSRVVGDVDHADLVATFDKALAATSADAAAEVILRGVQRDKARILVGRDARAIETMTRLLGPAYMRVVVAQSRRLARRRAARAAARSAR